MGKTFRSVIIASTGDFGDKTDKIKNWVEHAGGTFSKDIDPSVTHLVASKKAWKRYHPMVQAARRLKTIHIVKIDWLEDSLTMSKSRKPLDEAKYAYEQRNIKTKKASRTRKRNGHDKSHPNHDQLGVDDPNDKAGQKGEIAGTQVNTVADKHVEVGVHSTPGRDPATAKKKKQQQQQEQKHVATVVKKKQQQQPRLGWADQELHCSKDEQIEISAKEYDAECAEFERELGQHGYRPFIDANGFTFLVTLVREDILQNRLEKHRLKLFEHDPMANATAANANEKELKAKSYACYSIYIRPGHRYVTQLAPPGSTFDFAFTMFNKFFHKRVGVSWDDREPVNKKTDESAARDEDEWDLRGDGAGDALDRRFKFFGPKIVKQQPGIGDGTGPEVEIDSVEGRQRKPSVTVLMNPRKDAPRDEMDLIAKTPDGRW